MVNKFFESEHLRVLRSETGAITLRVGAGIYTYDTQFTPEQWVDFLIAATGENVSFHRALRHAEPQPA